MRPDTETRGHGASSTAPDAREQEALARIERVRGMPPRFRDEQITMAHGAGGKASETLVRGLFLPAFASDALDALGDAGLLDIEGLGLALTTDSFVVRPLRFPGGSIGELAVNGTVNDLAVSGARPLALTLSLVLEEGLSADALRAEVEAIAQAARAAGVRIVAGDTKVVERGRADGMYICTTGLGRLDPRARLSPTALRPGDRILVSGRIGEHGTAIMLARGEFELDAPVRSDTRSLWPAVDALLYAAGPQLRCLRDATRGGVATVLNELARASGVAVVVDEARIPVDPAVAGACELLGIDPMYVANEGKLVAVVAPEAADAALAALCAVAGSEDATEIGTVFREPPGMVLVNTAFGGKRVMDMLVGDPLPPHLLMHVAEAQLTGLVRARTEVNAAFFTAESERIARLCHRMAERFARGGRLLALGSSPQARSDARHVAVEFVHPVIVGKRALPARALTAEGGPPARQLQLLARPDDIVLAFDDAADAVVAAALDLARLRGCLTVGFPSARAEWSFQPPGEDVFVRQELVETLYHVLWELVHVFFEHRGLLEGRRPAALSDAGASSFLYPFLAEQEHDLESVVADVRRSVLMKADEVAQLRERAAAISAAELAAAAATLRASFDGGGTALVFGNGGSATDAMDLAADLSDPPAGRGWPARPVLDLTEDTAVLSAIVNDIGADAAFARQIIAYGRPGDTAVALSTSGDSRNLIEALAEARRRGLHTIALVGYDGGRIRAQALADHVLVVPSQHIPRIQEAQATLYHLLRELVETADG